MSYNYKELMDWKFSSYKWEMTDPMDYSTLVWKDKPEHKPTKQELEKKIDLLKAAHNNTAGQQRAKEYPSIGDQLDALFKAGVFPPEMAAQIQAVKDKWPKK